MFHDPKFALTALVRAQLAFAVLLCRFGLVSAAGDMAGTGPATGQLQMVVAVDI